MGTEFEFVMRRRKYKASRERVIEALREVEPEPETPYMVTIEGTAYPMRQAFNEAFGIERGVVGTVQARRVLERLGFEVSEGGMMQIRPRADAPKPRTGPWRPKYRPDRYDIALWETIELPDVHLQWSYVENWETLREAMGQATNTELPPAEPGVYEVSAGNLFARLYIGRAADLYARICYGLIGGTSPHTAGQKIRENEDLSKLSIRWAATDRPAAVEEALHLRHIKDCGHLPKYTTRT